MMTVKISVARGTAGGGEGGGNTGTEDGATVLDQPQHPCSRRTKMPFRLHVFPPDTGAYGGLTD